MNLLISVLITFLVIILVLYPFVSVVATIVFAVVGTMIILGILKAIMGLRVSEEEERMGLDLSQHNERAYE